MTVAELEFPAATAALSAAAVHYARHGLRVFPCVPEHKRPMTENGFKDATTSVGVVESWWRSWPWASIGIPTGSDGIDVLDIDVYASGDGYGAFADLEDAGLVDGWAAKVRTPSGGMHVYFPADPAWPQRNWAVAASHIDFRGEGGYVIAPPSFGAGTKRYELIDTAPAARPLDSARVRDFLRPPPPPIVAPPRALDRSPDAIVRRIAGFVARQSEGNRNRALFWAACRVAELELPEDYAHGALGMAALRAGLEQDEATATIRSAYRTVSATRSLHLDPGPAPPPLGL